MLAAPLDGQGFVFSAALAFLVVHPLARLVLASLTDPAAPGLTLENYAAAYGRARHLEALWNSVRLAWYPVKAAGTPVAPRRPLY